MVELFKCFGNQMREFLQSRHFVLLAYIRFSHNRLRYISENRTRLLSIQTGLSFITTNLHQRKRDLTTSYQQCMYEGLCLKKKAKNPQKKGELTTSFWAKKDKISRISSNKLPKTKYFEVLQVIDKSFESQMKKKMMLKLTNQNSSTSDDAG